MVELRIMGNNIGFLPMQQSANLLPGTLVHGPVLLGSVNADGFSGCIRMLYINEISINLNVNMSNDDPQLATPGCPREEICYPEPCANGGECVSTWNDFTCTCLADFTSTNCSECESFHILAVAYCH